VCRIAIKSKRCPAVIINLFAMKGETMQHNKRKFKRFDLPLIVKFRPIYGTADYSLGLTKNFSCEGLGLEASDFNFIQNENLELNLKFPQSGSVVSLFGDVVWKTRAGDKNMAGIKLRVDDRASQDEMIQKISAYSDISIKHIYGTETEDFMKAEKKEPSLPKPAGKISAKSKTEKSKKPVQKLAEKSESVSRTGFIKEYRKGGSKCKVTFRLPKEAAPDARQITIAGDFNNWETEKTPLSRSKDGDFFVTIDLKAKREYRFRYLIDGERWENDWRADKYIPNDFGSDDSVLII
jgi:hypothetical protein